MYVVGVLKREQNKHHLFDLLVVRTLVLRFTIVQTVLFWFTTNIIKILVFKTSFVRNIELQLSWHIEQFENMEMSIGMANRVTRSKLRYLIFFKNDIMVCF